MLLSAPNAKILFGLRLAELRREINWSQERLALESGIARSYLGGVERGQRNLSLVNICRLADTLNLPPSELLNFDSVMDVLNAKKKNTRQVKPRKQRSNR